MPQSIYLCCWWNYAKITPLTAIGVLPVVVWSEIFWARVIVAKRKKIIRRKNSIRFVRVIILLIKLNHKILVAYTIRHNIILVNELFVLVQSDSHRRPEYSKLNLGVGKTCLLAQFFEKIFKLDTDPTIGVEFASKTIQVNQKSIKLQIWDTVKYW